MSVSPSQPALSPQLVSKISWRLAPLMILMYIANQIDRANVGYAALTMNKDLELTTTQFGLATSIFYIGYIIFEVPSNVIMHRVGARIWMARILLTWGATSSLTSLVTTKEWLFAIRFVLGAFEAGLFPGMVFYMTLWMPARNRVFLMSMFVMAIPLTGVLGAPISTLIMEHVTLFGLSGWRTMLLIEGLPAIGLGLVVLFCLPDRPSHAKWLTSAEVREIETALAHERAVAASPEAGKSIAGVFKDAKVWLLGVVYFGINCAIISLLYFLPQVIKSLESVFNTKYSIVQIGFISAVPFGFAIVCMAIWGRYLSNRTIEPVHVVGPLLTCAAALAVALYLPSAYLALAAFAVGAAACFCTMITFWQLPSRFLRDRAAAAGIALITSIGVSAGVVMPYMIGWVKDVTGGYAAAFLGVSACIVLAAGVVVLLEFRLRRRPVPLVVDAIS